MQELWDASGTTTGVPCLNSVADIVRSTTRSCACACTDRVVGVHLVGPDAGELIQVIGIAIRMKATKADFDATMAVHPTVAEELVTMRTVTRSYGREAAE